MSSSGLAVIGMRTSWFRFLGIQHELAMVLRHDRKAADVSLVPNVSTVDFGCGPHESGASL